MSKLVYYLSCTCIYNPATKIKAVRCVLWGRNFSLIFLQHVSAALGHYQGKDVHEECKVYITWVLH
jgi:hypothetical protein